MKKIYILIIINLFCIRLQAQNFEWAKREGQGAYDYGKGIATDNSGNVYVAGKYELNANFSGTILPCQGNHDIYVAKYSSSGSLTWIRTAGGVNGDYAHALACDGAYVYVAGEIEGFGTTIKFIGSSVTLTSKGVNDAFLAKYDLNGNLIWAREAGGIDNDEALGITYDNSGNVYICGFFNNTATFGTTTVYGFGGNDIYVAKYDSNGVFQWVRTAGSAGRDEAKGIKCDAAGNVYVCGTYLDRTVFGSQILSSPNGYFNAFLAKYTPDGTLAWVKTAGGDYDDVAWGVAIDNADKIYIAGEFNAYALFDGIPLITTGSANVFVACYDESGNIQWAKGAGGRLIDRARAIGCDGTNLYITGQFGLLANFDSYSVTGVDSSEIFIAKLNNAGNFQWIATIGGPPDAYESLGYEAGDAVCAEPSGNVYTTGALLDGGVFGNISFNPYNRTDVFVCKISQNIVPPVTSNPSSITVMVGKQASFSVSATGSFPLTYQWEKNGINIPAANASSYIINNTQYTDTGHYNVVVTNIYGSDTSNSATLTVIPFINSSLCTASGTISRDYWANITGTSVSNIPINTAPTSTSQLSVFEAPQNLADNYGQRIRGYICPPLTGNYIFWISSDDNSELWLSTDDNPANKIKIASVTGWTSSREWTKYPTQQSAPISLIAGQKYYIEALHKEGSQGDNCAVGWQLPNGALERPIIGSRLSPFITSSINPPLVSITSPTDNTSYPGQTNITINATATSTGGSIAKVEFYQGITKIGEDLAAPYSFTWQNVTAGNYVLKAIATDNISQTATSQVVNISVNGCSTPKITALGPTTMCSGSVTLQSNTGSGFIYQWQKDGVNINGATNSSYTAAVSGGYQIKIIQGSCISWSAPTAVKIQSGLRASITPGGSTTFCTGGNVKLFANTCSGYIYQWKLNGSYIPGATASIYIATTAGNYQVQITQGGVNAWSALVTVTINACRESEINQGENANPVQAISEPSDPLNRFQMKIYPNPNTGFFTIIINMALTKEEKIKMRIVNVLGQEVYSKEYAIKDNYLKETVELDKSLPTGIYTLQLIIGNKTENTNVVLAR